MRVGILALALALALAPVLSARVALPIEAYGQLPNVDLIALSPDGSQMAMAVTAQHLRQVQVRRVGDRSLVEVIPTGTAKIRALTWAGDHHLLITQSKTADVWGLTGPKREWYLVLDLNLLTHKPIPLLNGDVQGAGKKLNTVDGVPEVRMINGHPIAFVEGTTFPGSQGIRTLFRVDLDKRWTRREALGNEGTDGWLIDNDGAIAARVD